MLDMEHFGGAAEAYFPAARVSAVIMPLIDVIDATKSAESELREEANSAA
jgi:hypothetical protein